MLRTRNPDFASLHPGYACYLLAKPSLEQIIVDDFGIFLKFRNSFLREKMDAVVQHFLLRRISASIFRKEAVGKIIPYNVDAMDCETLSTSMKRKRLRSSFCRHRSCPMKWR